MLRTRQIFDHTIRSARTPNDESKSAALKEISEFSTLDPTRPFTDEAMKDRFGS
jgi:hypothetical protein